MRPFRFNFALLVIGSFCFPISESAFAGSYRVSYSGGQVVSVFYGPGGGTMTFPYWGTELGYGGIGGVDGVIFPNGGEITLSGAITVDFVWDNGGNPNDLPPQTIILAERSMARYQGYGSGSCSNGLGHPPVANEWGAVSEGTRYTIRSNPGQQFQLTCTPAANIQVNAGGAGYAQVGYSVTLTPVVLNVRGTTRANDRDNVLIGQGIQCTVSAGSYRLDNLNWSSSGSYFGSVDWGPPLYGGEAPAYRRVWTPHHSLSMFNLYFDQGGLPPDGESTLIECTTDIYAGKELVGAVTVRKIIWVWRPRYEFRYTEGTHEYYPSPASAECIQTTGPGMYFQGWVETPTLFRTPLPGVWSYAQLCTINRWQLLSTGFLERTTSADQSLDNSFPYPLPIEPWAADGSPWSVVDNPDYYFFIGAELFSIQDYFNMMQIYLPPRAMGLYSSEWVPIHSLSWQWRASGSRTIIPPSPWLGPFGGIFALKELSMPGFRFLQWEDVFRNRD